MKGLDYNIAVAVLFPLYIVAEVPSNMILKRFRPGIWLSILSTTWAIIMICQGLVHNYNGLLACRIFLGLAEAGIYPGMVYYITMWYRRQECGFRIALVFSSTTIAGAFGGLLAHGISNLEGVGGRASWSWIFIIEGLVTLLVALSSYYFISDGPVT